MIGQVFGKLTLIANETHRSTGAPTVRWVCVCECGRKRVVQWRQLERRVYTTCGQKGCKSTMVPKHGKTGSPEYRAWGGLKSRCLNPNSLKFYMYGGAGITVCKRWLKFENFYADMGDKPSARHSLGRINGKRGYCPSNCRWELPFEQQANISFNRNLRFRGETRNVSAWARKLGISKETISSRLRNGWTIENALGRPTYTYAHDGRQIRPKMTLTYNEQTLTMSEWARVIGVPAHRIWQRYRRGLPLERVLSAEKFIGRRAAKKA